MTVQLKLAFTTLEPFAIPLLRLADPATRTNVVLLRDFPINCALQSGTYLANMAHVSEIIYSAKRFGRQHCAGADFPRHRHSLGYMCLILSGGLVEAGDAGRFRAGPGDVLVHKPFEAHLDLLGVKGAELLNLPLAPDLPEGLINIGDPDAIARLAEGSPVEASKAVAAAFSESVGERDWPDVLAASLRKSASFSIRQWARGHGLTPETVSRGFRQAYGTTPRRYLAEARTRRAWFALSAGTQSLAEIAFDLGFADQSHMTRWLTGMTGLSPGKWRGQVSSRPADP